MAFVQTFLTVAFFSLASPAAAATAVIAVATNFADAADAIARDFESQSVHHIKISLGSTGKLYAQIRSGAPFDALLAADEERPRKLLAENLAVAGSRITYATGRLTLWSADPTRITGDPKTLLASPQIQSIAIANPALAPYGLAARQVLENMGLWPAVKSRIVMGQNVGQTFALVATGNANVGFVATPLLRSKRASKIAGSWWDVPAILHAPIRQDAVLLNHGRDNPAATLFLHHIASPKARAIMVKLGYEN